MLNQQLNLKIQQKLSPLQIQVIKMLEYPAVELEERIREEMISNPALEADESDMKHKDGEEYTPDNEEYAEERAEKTERDDELEWAWGEEADDDTPDYRLHASNRSADDDTPTRDIAGGESFSEYLIDQLSTLNLDKETRELAEYIIGSIDSDGYLRRTIETLIDDRAMAVGKMADEEQMLRALRIVQSLDPAGVGAKDLQECMLLQLNRMKDSPARRTAIDVVEQAFSELGRKQYPAIMKKLEIDRDTLSAALELIKRLNPKPGNSFGDGADSIARTITPDFIVDNDNGRLTVTLNNGNLPELRVSSEYSNMVKDYMGNEKNRNSEMRKAIQFAKQKIDAANWFIDAIRQRNETLLMTMKAIVELQHDYFLDGDERKLKPMKLKDVADRVGYDISTISRVSNSKYVQTGWGLLPLKHFFSESLYTADGEEISNKEVKRMISEAVAREDKQNPVTDDALADMLREKGYVIARRTIAKYREQLGIPVARLRRQTI